MKVKALIAVVALLVSATSIADAPFELTYRTVVDEQGNISLPKNFRRSWAFLGTWSIAAKDVKTSSEGYNPGAAGLHNVYTQQETIDYFRKTGKFPDGAVLVKELLQATTGTMTTGTVSWGTEVEGWFVMVKDTEGRFSNNPLWGDGWGWAFFEVGQPDKTKTKNYKTECTGCHIPARNDDWIYINGYPALKVDK